jgi:hypothetical protein
MNEEIYSTIGKLVMESIKLAHDNNDERFVVEVTGPIGIKINCRPEECHHRPKLIERMLRVLVDGYKLRIKDSKEITDEIK